ncbi:MAG: hypothetical protein IPH48_09620 [bacterium]|nr:hypothetical protein [bacterium]
MKKLFMLATIAVAMLAAGQSLATIGWAGNVWPNAGSAQVPTGPFNVYVQVWKGGVTDAPGQGADIQVTMNVTNSLGGTDTVVMGFQGDAGANDEYTGQVAQAMLAGAATVTVDFVVTDLSDMTTFGPINDQAGHTAPLTYNVTNVLPNDVAVTFTVCMSGEPTSGAPCVIGSAGVIGSWGTGVGMTQVSGDLYNVVVTFPAGINPNFDYKFKKDGCNSWESASNRPVTLPTDGTTAVTLATDSWNNLPLGCGIGQTLTEAKVICFQVCVDAVGTAGGVCVLGSTPELTGWTTGVAMTEISSGLYQACIAYPAGTPIPLNFQYKFKKDGCASWESVADRPFTLDNASASETTVSHNWDDGIGACATVGTEDESWGALKSMFR